jgi:hypothetical protein
MQTATAPAPLNRAFAYQGDATGRPVAVLCVEHAPRALATWWMLKNARLVETTTHEPCNACRDILETAARDVQMVPAMRAALVSPLLSHTRAHGRFVHAYHRDHTSPTGVVLAGTLVATLFAELSAELRGTVSAGALSPLSPTEGR